MHTRAYCMDKKYVNTFLKMKFKFGKKYDSIVLCRKGTMKTACTYLTCGIKWKMIRR